jgi:hypothetical protein
MKRKIIEFQTKVKQEIKRLCGKPSPMKRFVAVLIIGGVLAVANIYILINSIYSIGRRDVQMEYIRLQHIESLQLQQSNDTIYTLKQQDEYDKQQSSGGR